MVDDASRPAASAMSAPTSPTPTVTPAPTSAARASVSPTPDQRPTVLASGSGTPESLALGPLEQGLPPLEEGVQLLACAVPLRRGERDRVPRAGPFGGRPRGPPRAPRGSPGRGGSSARRR